MAVLIPRLVDDSLPAFQRNASAMLRRRPISYPHHQITKFVVSNDELLALLLETRGVL